MQCAICSPENDTQVSSGRKLSINGYALGTKGEHCPFCLSFCASSMTDERSTPSQAHLSLMFASPSSHKSAQTPRSLR